MPGVVFVICVPTANYERELLNGTNYDNSEFPPPPTLLPSDPSLQRPSSNNFNINLPESNSNAVLRLDLELRDKNLPPPPRNRGKSKPGLPTMSASSSSSSPAGKAGVAGTNGPKETNCFIPMEKVLDELLKKLEIDHVTWTLDKHGEFHQVVFPLQSGDSCETTLHCLTELDIGKKLQSNVSNAEEESKWNSFVDSIRSKLTVKQVVDGVRAGGSLSFDYLLLIVTADSLAALGLVENNAPNIVAAMLVSPLMGPVMSITFGAIISDRELMRVGFISLALGMFISILFGFIFGLILGTTDMPWGFGDWPTEEMKGRGNARSLWMGVLWALTSGTGVAVALLQGSAGPLIGVAISASLLPPVVNCGLFWALACIWLIYDDIKMPHLKGELYSGNSSYTPIYTNYIPTEFLINGIVSALLTVVNVICIFITAIIVLKIKEVAAPYTSSPDLRRFWETDIRTVRKTNRSTIRRKNDSGKLTSYAEMLETKSKNLETVLEQAFKEAVDDETFRKVKRMSYSSNAADELPQSLAFGGSNNIAPSTSNGNGNNTARNTNRISSNSKIGVDLATLDKLVTSLLEHHNHHHRGGGGNDLNSATNFNRLRPLSHSLRSFGGGSLRRNKNQYNQQQQQQQQHHHHQQGHNNNPTTSASSTTINNDGTTTIMPTILEGNNQGGRTTSWSSDRSLNHSGVRHVLNTIANAPHRFSQVSGRNNDEENNSLTRNIVD